MHFLLVLLKFQYVVTENDDKVSVSAFLAGSPEIPVCSDCDNDDTVRISAFLLVHLKF